MENIFANFIFLPFLTALIITAVSTPICLIFLKKFKIIDYPNRKHPGVIHTKPIPRGGGIPLFIGSFAAGVFFLPLNPMVGAIFLASFIALVVGVLDDKYDISPYLRFGMNILCAVIVVAAGVKIAFITNPLGGILNLNEFNYSFQFFAVKVTILLSDVVAVLWIVWVMNMLNWSKGVDGQMPGIVAISAAVIGILALRFGVTDVNNQIATILSFIITGAAIGFLFFNFHPAKIFPGYGATSIYLLLAVVAIISSAKLATAILVMGVPLADGAFTIGRRVISGHSPFWHDRKHLHHLLLSNGVGQRGIALFYWILSAIFGLLALVLSSKGKIFAIIMLVIIVGGTLLFLNLLLVRRNGKETI